MTELTMTENYFSMNLVFIMQKEMGHLQFWIATISRLGIAIFITFASLEAEVAAFNYIAPIVEGNQFFRAFIIIVSVVSVQVFLLAVRKYDFTLEACFIVLGIFAIVFSRSLTLVNPDFGLMLLTTGIISIFLFAYSVSRLFYTKEYG